MTWKNKNKRRTQLNQFSFSVVKSQGQKTLFIFDVFFEKKNWKFFISKFLLIFWNDPSWKFYELHKGSLQNLQGQASIFLVILQFSFQKLSKFEIYKFFRNNFIWNSKTYRGSYWPFIFFGKLNTIDVIHDLLYHCFQTFFRKINCMKVQKVIQVFKILYGHSQLGYIHGKNMEKIFE